MSTVLEIQDAMSKLADQEQWQIAEWLLHNLRQKSAPALTSENSYSKPLAKLPNYAAIKQEIFGDEILPNMVLLAREEERW